MRGRATLLSTIVLTVIATSLGVGNTAPRTPVTINCSTSPALTISTPGRYIVAGAPTENCGANTGILINVGGVDLDMDGVLLDGVDAASSVGIVAVAGVTVRNGSLRDFTEGIRNDFGGLRVYDFVVTSMVAWGITLGSDSTIQESTFADNASYGILASSADSLRIVRNVITGNGAGMSVRSSNTIVGNRIVGNSAEGIAAQSDNRILRNRVKGNSANGMNVSGPNNTIKRNKANDNQGDGINAPGDVGTVISDNVANRNLGRGISSGPNVRGRDNRARGNGVIPQCDPTRLC